MLCNGFLMNIWQIEMERSPYSNTLLFNRNTKLSLSIGVLLLFPTLVQGADSLYDQQILQARQGQYAPFLSYLQQYQLRHALTPSQVADWLQVALWAGQDDEVVKIWRRYQVYMPLPARGTAAAAQALRNQKQWQASLLLWLDARQLDPGGRPRHFLVRCHSPAAHPDLRRADPHHGKPAAAYSYYRAGPRLS